MTFGQSVSSVLRNYVNFSDRASRSEFWFWRLFTFICVIVLLVLLSANDAFGILLILFVLGIILPDLAVTVRRLHDTDRSGWWILIDFIPLIGPIVLLIWFCTRGTPGPNRFGEDPLGGPMG